MLHKKTMVEESTLRLIDWHGSCLPAIRFIFSEVINLTLFL